LSNRLIDILDDESVNENLAYRKKVIPKLTELSDLIRDSIPMKEEDLVFVVDLMLDLEHSPDHRASKMELKYCNELWKKYKKCNELWKKYKK